MKLHPWQYPVKLCYYAHVTSTDAARQALAIVEGLPSATDEPDNPPLLLWSTPLVTALAPLERHPAIGLRCTCGRGIGWAAYGPGGIGFSGRRVKPREQTGGLGDLDHDHSPAVTNATPWPASGQAGMVTVRRVIVCGTCRARHYLTPGGALRLWLRAVARGEVELLLGRRPGTARASGPHVERLADRGSVRAYGTKRARVASR